jgi:putative GTP pyrophosphokinase
METRGDELLTYEEFYGASLTKLEQTESLLLDLAQTYSESVGQSDQLRPIVYFCSRIKSPESVARKCRVRGLNADVGTALDNLFDLVGIRIICAFSADVYRLAEWLKSQPGIRIMREKDYYACPKPNGYRSYHLQLSVLSTEMPAEIQLRTIATDFWATLEHQIKYKKEIPNENMIRDELKRCADEIASVDLSMQTIREVIQESLS